MNKLQYLKKTKFNKFGLFLYQDSFLKNKQKASFYPASAKTKISVTFIRDGYFFSEFSGVLLRSVLKPAHVVSVKGLTTTAVFEFKTNCPMILRVKKI